MFYILALPIHSFDIMQARCNCHKLAVITNPWRFLEQYSSQIIEFLTKVVSKYYLLTLLSKRSTEISVEYNYCIIK